MLSACCICLLLLSFAYALQSQPPALELGRSQVHARTEGTKPAIRLGANERIPVQIRSLCMPKLHPLKGSWITPMGRRTTEQFTVFSAVLYTAARGDAVDTYGRAYDPRLQVLSPDHERVMRVVMTMPISTVETRDIALEYYRSWRFQCRFEFSNTTSPGTYIPDDNALLVHCELPVQEVANLMSTRMVAFSFQDLSHNGEVKLHACAEDAWTGGDEDATIPMPPKHRYYTACVRVRNEACFLEEWLDFNLLKGVDHIYVYDDSSTDASRERVQPYVQSGKVTLIDWSFEVYKTKTQALQMNDCMYRARDFTVWQEHTDVDEFLFSANPTVSMKQFLRAMEDLSLEAASLSVEQYLFGDSNIDLDAGWPDRCGRYLITQDHLYRGDGVTYERMKPIHRVDLCNVVWVHKASKYVGSRVAMDTRRDLRCNHYWVNGRRAQNPRLNAVRDVQLWQQFGQMLEEKREMRQPPP
jgi:hypothetical protein